MEVTTDSECARKAQQLVLELRQSDLPAKAHTRHNDVDEWAAWLGFGAPRFAARAAVAPNLSHPAIVAQLDACIQCARCRRGAATQRTGYSA